MGRWNKSKKIMSFDSGVFELSVSDALKKYELLWNSLSERCPVHLSFGYGRQTKPGVVGTVTDLYPNGSRVELLSNMLFDATNKFGMRLMSGLNRLDGETVVLHVITYNHEVEHARQHV